MGYRQYLSVNPLSYHAEKSPLELPELSGINYLIITIDTSRSYRIVILNMELNPRKFHLLLGIDKHKVAGSIACRDVFPFERIAILAYCPEVVEPGFSVAGVVELRATCNPHVRVGSSYKVVAQ